MNFKERLIELNACHEAITWAGDKSAKEVYETCERGDWLLWWFFKEHRRQTEGFPDIKQITKAKVKCASLVEHLMKDDRSKNALKVAWDWANGNATDEELASASVAAYYVSAYAYASAAYAYARTETQRKCANIVREYLKLPENYLNEN